MEAPGCTKPSHEYGDRPGASELFALPAVCEHCKLRITECAEGSPHGRCKGHVHVLNRAHACRPGSPYVAEPQRR